MGTDSTVARLAAVTGGRWGPDAFAKLVVNPEREHLLWTPKSLSPTGTPTRFADLSRVQAVRKAFGALRSGPKHHPDQRG